MSNSKINFSDLVQMVREKFTVNGVDNLGYAKAAKMVDIAIAPQIIDILDGCLELDKRYGTPKDDADSEWNEALRFVIKKLTPIKGE